MATEKTTHLIDRLASLSNLARIPRKELSWLVEHGHFAVYEVGTLIGPKGKRISKLWIILSGKIAIRVDRGAGPRLVAEKEFVDVEPGIRDTLSVLISKVKSKSATITLEIDSDLPRVYANGSDLNQIWFSLIDNALDAISQLGNICIEASSELKRVVVHIIDDGPGIASDVISRIFDPFYTTKAPGHGTGLSLNLTQRLLRRYHGDISVESRTGRTDFCISLLVGKPEIANINPLK
jgi:signal transduction histidine kinase